MRINVFGPSWCNDTSEDSNVLEEVVNFPDTSKLTDETTLLNHFEDLKRLESCDPLASAYRVGTSVIIPYNVGGRQNA